MKDFPRGFRVTRFHKFNIAQPVRNMREVKPKCLFYLQDVAAKNVNRFCFWRIVLDQLAIYNRFPLVQSLSILKHNRTFFYSEQTHSFFMPFIFLVKSHFFLHTVSTQRKEALLCCIDIKIFSCSILNKLCAPICLTECACPFRKSFLFYTGFLVFKRFWEENLRRFS